MQNLPVDPKRGYVVPKFVQWINGEPDFRIMNGEFLLACIERRLCWTCGNPLGGQRGVFVIGPMCVVNRNTAEPPNHVECARFSAKACPFLTMPKMRRREDEVSKIAEGNVAGIAIKRNPGVACLWFAADFKPYRDPRSGGPLFRLGTPLAIEWYCEGREATREEVMHSIDTGLPIVREMAEKDGPEGVQYLEREIERAMRWVPA